MKTVIAKEILQEKIAAASRFTLTKLSSSSSLQGGKLTFSPNKLAITTTNLNDFFYTEINTENRTQKEIVVDIKKISEFLSFLAPGKISLEVKEKALFLTSGKTVGTFPLISTDDFPAPPIIEGKKHTLPRAFWEKNLPLVLFSASSDETRPVLTGVHFSHKDDEGYLAATDGFRLSVLRDKEIKPLLQTTVSARVLQEILRLKSASSSVGITFSEKEKMVLFTVGDQNISSRLIEGDFPPFERVIPADTTTKAVLPAQDFLKNIKLAAVFARDFSNIVLLEIKKDGLYLRPRTKEEKDTLIYQEAEIEGEETRIAFNYAFVLDFLTAAKGGEVVLEMTQGNAPALFRIKGNDVFLHVIMPVRLDEETSS